MERFAPFEIGEFYHIYNRGIDKRKIFFSKGDWVHFQRLLYICNSTGNNLRPARVKNKPLVSLDRGSTLVDLCAYTLVDNHYHLLLYEKTENGISMFMQKLLTAYSMYMNKKYRRTGPLMCRPFRSTHIDSDSYLRWLVVYIHLNIIDKHQPNWKEYGIKNKRKSVDFMKKYRFSSFTDYYVGERDESDIINKVVLSTVGIDQFDDLPKMLKEYQTN